VLSLRSSKRLERSTSDSLFRRLVSVIHWDHRPTEFYTPQALRDDILTPYITTKNLVHPTERKYIVLDEVLKTAILTKKEPDVEHLARDKALERLVAMCQAWYELGRDGKTERR
jgi:hypothetical protein